ncbi:MAG: hypothetical protein A2X36_13660 [Elusimicrobia bacterium GWA2_69_24]|nr:MAG: hypothetical protein A2X36_13660 [Elusimicrobia bacterium GWA2_69_24]HBL18686.1 hypothetical protein [Elusimicrobiota bacterium]
MPSILVVDDESAVRALCRRALARSGHAVALAEDGESALRALEADSYDILLTDINLPGKSGVALTREASRLQPGLGIIIMTGGPTYETAVATLQEGACDYLPKPFDPDALRAAVQRCSDRRALAAGFQTQPATDARLRLANERLRQAEELQNGFLSIVSHELRTPLAVMLGSVDLLAETRDRKQHARGIAMLRQNLKRLHERVETLLNYASLRRGDVAARREQLSLRTLADFVLEDYRADLRSKDLSCTAAHAEDLPLLWGDAHWLRIALHELVDNAVRFTPARGAIRLETWQEGPRVLLRIANTGAAVVPSELPWIFDAFRQTEPHLTRRTGGLGLGLAIADEVVRLHGGNLTAASRPGEGTTLTLSLPRA